MSNAHLRPTTHLKLHTTRLPRLPRQLCLPCKPSLSLRHHACPRLRERKSNVHRLLSLRQCMNLQRARWKSTTTMMTVAMMTSAPRNRRAVAAVRSPSMADLLRQVAQPSSRLKKLLVDNDLIIPFAVRGDDYDVHVCLRGKASRARRKKIIPI